MTAARLALRNAPLFGCSFAVSGLTNVHAQQFFAGGGTARKDVWLAGTLLLGTIASMAAIRAATRFGPRGRAGPASVVLLLGALLVAALSVEALAAYVVLHVLVRGAANAVAYESDRRATAAAGALRTRNDQLGSGLRFGGMLAGPLWLALVPGDALATRIAIGALVALSLAAYLVDDAPVTRPGSADAAEARAWLAWDERPLWIAGLAIYGSYYLLASSALYLLRDVHRLPNAGSVAGALIGTVYATAIATTIVRAALSRRGLGLGWMLPAPVSMLLVAGVVGHPAAADLRVLFAGGAWLGVCFALFLLALRNHVTERAAAGQVAWLAAYNDLGNGSALVGFAMMLLAAGMPVVVPYEVKLGIALAVLATAAMAGAALDRRVRGARGVAPAVGGTEG